MWSPVRARRWMHSLLLSSRTSQSPTCYLLSPSWPFVSDAGGSVDGSGIVGVSGPLQGSGYLHAGVPQGLDLGAFLISNYTLSLGISTSLVAVNSISMLMPPIIFLLLWCLS